MFERENEIQLHEIISDTLGVDINEINDYTSPESLPEWTSLRHLSLMAAVEEAFGITLSLDEMNSAQSYKSLRDILGQHLR